MTTSIHPSPNRTPAPDPASRGRAGRAALPLLFGVLGLVFAAWAARIPTIRDTLHLSPGELGAALLCAGIGGLASFPLAAGMVARYGQARAAFCGGAALLLALPCIALSTRLPLLMAALGLLGAAASCFDVAINAIGAAAEKRAGRSIMSMLHAWFCVGTVAGALSGSLLASLEVPPVAHFSVLCAAMLGPVWRACRTLESVQTRHAGLAASAAHAPDATGSAARQSPAGATAPCSAALPRRLARKLGAAYRLPPRPLLLLGLIGFCGAIAEGGIADWSGVFMQDHLGAGRGAAPLGYAAFSAAMLATRLVADRLKDRFGARRVVAGGVLLAMLGNALAVAGIGLVPSIAGFALVGAGLAGVFPFVFSAAGRDGPTALAGVATVSYCGALAGPPAIGFIAQFAGLQAALGSLGVLCAVMASMALRARRLD